MSEQLYLLTIGLFLGTILIIFGMKYLSALRQAQTRTLAEQAHAALAERMTAVQQETAGSLAAIKLELAAIRTTLAGVEKVLKAVE